jgi:hypothetical protein
VGPLLVVILSKASTKVLSKVRKYHFYIFLLHPVTLFLPSKVPSKWGTFKVYLLLSKVPSDICSLNLACFVRLLYLHRNIIYFSCTWKYLLGVSVANCRLKLSPVVDNSRLEATMTWFPRMATDFWYHPRDFARGASQKLDAHMGRSMRSNAW